MGHGHPAQHSVQHVGIGSSIFSSDICGGLKGFAFNRIIREYFPARFGASTNAMLPNAPFAGGTAVVVYTSTARRIYPLGDHLPTRHYSLRRSVAFLPLPPAQHISLRTLPRYPLCDRVGSDADIRIWRLNAHEHSTRRTRATQRAGILFLLYLPPGASHHGTYCAQHRTRHFAYAAACGTPHSFPVYPHLPYAYANRSITTCAAGLRGLCRRHHDLTYA